LRPDGCLVKQAVDFVKITDPFVHGAFWRGFARDVTPVVFRGPACSRTVHRFALFASLNASTTHRLRNIAHLLRLRRRVMLTFTIPREGQGRRAAAFANSNYPFVYATRGRRSAPSLPWRIPGCLNEARWCSFQLERTAQELTGERQKTPSRPGQFSKPFGGEGDQSLANEGQPPQSLSS
jgi:hypothetical protein